MSATDVPGRGTNPSSATTWAKHAVYSAEISPETSRERPHSAHVTVARASNYFSPAAGNTGVKSIGMSARPRFTASISGVAWPYFASRAAARL